MIKFTAVIEKFGKKGEKTGWTYLTIDSETAEKIKVANKKSFRVKGQLDNYKIESVSLLPMGDGNFIMPLNANLRKGIKKQIGDKVFVQITEDTKPFQLAEDFLDCLADEKTAKVFFDSLSTSHRNYFSKGIDSAKTTETRVKRIAQSINGLKMKMGYPEMLRYYKTKKIS